MWFEQQVPIEVGQRNVTESARRWAVKLAALRSRQLARLESLADAPELAIPVWTDGSPALLEMGDALWLIVSTKGPQDLDWSFQKDYRGWISVDFEGLAARLADEVMLYIDEGGPLVPAERLNRVSLELLRAARRHPSGPEPAELFPASRLHHRAQDATVGETAFPVFTSRLAAWAYFGEIPTASSPGRVLARAAGTGGTFLLDPGRPHSLEIRP